MGLFGRNMSKDLWIRFLDDDSDVEWDECAPLEVKGLEGRVTPEDFWAGFWFFPGFIRATIKKNKIGVVLFDDKPYAQHCLATYRAYWGHPAPASPKKKLVRSPSVEDWFQSQLEPQRDLAKAAEEQIEIISEREMRAETIPWDPVPHSRSSTTPDGDNDSEASTLKDDQPGDEPVSVRSSGLRGRPGSGFGCGRRGGRTRGGLTRSDSDTVTRDEATLQQQFDDLERQIIGGIGRATATLRYRLRRA